ncbi:restriction endonuclease subunit S [Bradyrhizobium sp. CCGUVB4N]|uniref:restriction endonuclease subunit S n=1 Tax=Bradyrhizobium sp. CCGUVB4N TaxID=2949631 RepID=UPI0020B19F17|nr:restriction endonuclease subunit S [Bradyrhizobium sp. CCGUVB4N]MCP3386209.1 restriction endonuclease subunit S [Bradyrhizobium sp. CCGUVB4N]
MSAVRLLKHYEKIAEAPDAIARLRQFVLDLAVRGRLVPQDANDEPAVNLLKRIANERARLGIQNVIVPNASDEVPFELPTGWSWSRVGEICSKTGSGSTPRGGKDVYKSSGIPFLRSQNVYDDGLRLADVAYIDPETHARMSGTRVLAGDLLLNITGGSMGRCCLVPSEFGEANISQHVAIIRVAVRGLETFLHRLVLSPYFQAFIFDEQTGAGRGGLPKNRMDQIAVAMPPFAEQQRIIAKVDELMELCDRLEIARAKREGVRDKLAAADLARLNAPAPETFQSNIRCALDALPALTARPDQIKGFRQTILNLAMRGKLVPQEPNDEPASESLKRISVERAELVKKKEVRREHPFEPLKLSEVPFGVPRSWVWARIGEAVLFTQYGTSQKANPSEEGVPVLTMGNIQDGLVVWSDEKRIPSTSDDLPVLYLRKFDLLYNRTNSAELVGKTGIYLGDDDARTFASYLIRLRPSLSSSNPRFLNLAMNTPDFRETQIQPLIKKQTGQANVNGTALKNMLIPLPPLAEQYRIVVKVDELMGLCDRLEAGLAESSAIRRHLLDALIAEALTPADIYELEAAE